MRTVKEYFADAYRSVPKPIVVCGSAGETVYSTYAAAPFLDQPLPKKLLKEASACIQKERGSTIPLKWLDRDRVVYCTPARYEGETFAVLEIAAVAEYPELPKLMVALSNLRGKLNRSLDTVYFAAQQMGMKDGRGKELGQEVRYILRAAEHVDRLLDMTDRANYRIPMELNQFASAMAQGFEKLKLRGTVAVEPSKKKRFVRVMPENLELVVATLVSNAFRFGADQVVLRTSSVGKKVRLTVADNGKGVEDPARLFECGYRTRDKLGGEGLGVSLAMAQHVLARQDAALQYERVEGETRFHIVMAAANLPENIRLSDWKVENTRNSLSQLRVELSDYMMMMDYEE